jgi:hypothetical protein
MYLDDVGKNATTGAAAEITRRSLRVLLRRLMAHSNGSAAQRAVEAVELIEAGAAPGKLSIADAAALRHVSAASVRTVLQASPRDRLALLAGASIASIKRSSAPPRSRLHLVDLWDDASGEEQAELLDLIESERQFYAIIKDQLDTTAALPAAKPNGAAHPTM